MSIEQAERIYQRLEPMMRLMEFSDAMGSWSDENQIRLAKMFGLGCEVELKPVSNGLARVTQGKPFPTGSSYRPFDSLWDSYTTVSGDANGYYIGKRVQQNAMLPSFEDLLANVFNRLLWSDFGPTNYRWQDIVTSITAPPDYRQNVRTGLNYVSDLPTLPEDQPFAELTALTDVQGEVTYNVLERGALLTFSRRVIINDDVDLMKRSVEQIKRSVWRTLAKRVWSLISSNSTYGPDGVALFNAAHGNVTSGGGAALSAAMLTTARNAMFAQTERGGKDLLGLGGGPLLLAVPIALEATAIQINRAPWLSLALTGDVGAITNATAAPTLNEWKHRLGKDNENIFANPLLPNTQDWFLFDTSRNVNIIEVGFLQGQQMPRILVSDNPLADETFTQDRVIYKVVHEYDAALLDYRGCYAGLVS